MFENSGMREGEMQVIAPLISRFYLHLGALERWGVPAVAMKTPEESPGQPESLFSVPTWAMPPFQPQAQTTVIGVQSAQHCGSKGQCWAHSLGVDTTRFHFSGLQAGAAGLEQSSEDLPQRYSLSWASWVHLALATSKWERRRKRLGDPLLPFAQRSAASFPAPIHAKQLKLSAGRGGTLGSTES